MEKSLTREEMRELDRKAIEEYKIPGIILMENAGRNVAEEVLKMIKAPRQIKVAILCGKGNNGGDGFVVARHLHNHNISVNVFLVARISDILKDGDAGTNLRILLQMKIPVREILDTAGVISVLKELDSYDIIIDALFGTGLSGEVREPFKTLINGVNNLVKPIVSVDIPSGLDCNNGNVLGAAIKAIKTVTFAASKRGFYLGDGPAHTGEVVITDISIPKKLMP
ncbi:MAG: NAD(P)H-hydrate epimerase [Candidatus Brocadia sp.]